MSPVYCAEIDQALASLESKQQSARLEIVAFGTISSGKSTLLNRGSPGGPYLPRTSSGAPRPRVAKSPGRATTKSCWSILRGWPR